MRAYELMIIHRPEMAETDVERQVGEVESAIAEEGAVLDRELWGKRRFAYEIDHLNEGYYSVVSFTSTPGLVDRIGRALQLSDAVVRHKIVRLDED